MLTDLVQHCGRDAFTDPCPDDCGIETCHAIYCSKCLEQLADYDCAPSVVTR